MKPNIGPLDTVLPEENRYDEWLVPEHEERYNKMIKKVVEARKRYYKAKNGQYDRIG